LGLSPEALAGATRRHTDPARTRVSTRSPTGVATGEDTRLSDATLRWVAGIALAAGATTLTRAIPAPEGKRSSGAGGTLGSAATSIGARRTRRAPRIPAATGIVTGETPLARHAQLIGKCTRPARYALDAPTCAYGDGSARASCTGKDGGGAAVVGGPIRAHGATWAAGVDAVGAPRALNARALCRIHVGPRSAVSGDNAPPAPARTTFRVNDARSAVRGGGAGAESRAPFARSYHVALVDGSTDN